MNTKTRRTLSVSGVIACLLVAASPAWAHHEAYYGYGPRHVHPYRPAVLWVPPVVRYRYAPAPVYYAPPPVYVPAPTYYAPPPAYGPAPAYYGPPAYAPAGTIGGAVVGAAIGSGLGQGNGRTAAIAIGSVVGAVLGGQLAGGR